MSAPYAAVCTALPGMTASLLKTCRPTGNISAAAAAFDKNNAFTFPGGKRDLGAEGVGSPADHDSGKPLPETVGRLQQYRAHSPFLGHAYQPSAAMEG